MKTMKAYFLLVLFAGVIGGCQSFPVSREPEPEVRPAVEFEEVDPEQLTPANILALITFDLAKGEVLESIPTVRVNSDGKNFENKTDYDAFKQQNMVILESTRAPDGIHAQTMVVESIDNYGRIDLSRNHIAYRLRDADEEEVTAIEKSFTEGGRAVKDLDEKQRADFEEAVTEYQRARGLNPDGMLGPKTAKSLASGASILDVQELTSHVLYPKKPRHLFYILDFETVEKEPEKFYKGFESLAEVMKNALTIDDLRFLRKGQPKKEFVLFVYFFDRVNPNLPINVCLSSRAKRETEFMSPTCYAVPEKWPVLVETISMEKQSAFLRLYANLFINKKYVSSFRLR